MMTSNQLSPVSYHNGKTKAKSGKLWKWLKDKIYYKHEPRISNLRCTKIVKTPSQLYD